jgi:uncharacterized membrane protein YeaQ/YmgE (transglycosylase-associated protein family)
MIWPFRRGAVGVLLNVLAGMTGALLAVLFSYVVIQGAGAESPLRLAFAALGSWVGLVIVHVAWTSWSRHAQAHPQGGRPGSTTVGVVTVRTVETRRTRP